jgi:hypothetical protein
MWNFRQDIVIIIHRKTNQKTPNHFLYIGGFLKTTTSQKNQSLEGNFFNIQSMYKTYFNS